MPMFNVQVLCDFSHPCKWDDPTNGFVPVWTWVRKWLSRCHRSDNRKPMHRFLFLFLIFFTVVWVLFLNDLLSFQTEVHLKGVLMSVFTYQTTFPTQADSWNQTNLWSSRKSLKRVKLKTMLSRGLFSLICIQLFFLNL